MEDFENNNNICFDNTDFDFCGCLDPATGTMSCFENQTGTKEVKVSPPNGWTTFTTELMESGLSESQRQGNGLFIQRPRTCSTSSSSSTSRSPFSSSWSSASISFEDSEAEGHQSQTDAQLTLDIKSQLQARDRDNEIEYLLKRKSLQLSRQSSVNTCCGPVMDLGRLPAPDSANGHTPTTLNSHSDLARTYSSTSTVSSTKSTSNPTLPAVLSLAKSLHDNCDVILDRSTPFVIDSSLLFQSSEAINEIISRSPTETENCTTDPDAENLLLFLSDFFIQTPSLSITTLKSSDLNTSPALGSLDLTLFRSLESLNLRRVTPSTLSGLNTVRVQLTKLKIYRSLENINEIFTEPNESALGLTSVWPALRDIDLSYNCLTQIDSKLFEVTPSVEILNLSRNRISSIDSCFSRVLNCLTILNLNKNQLTSVPPLPANVKVLLISNNCITSIGNGNLFMGQLEVLDLSQNQIAEEKGLEALRQLSSLKILAFSGNPISNKKKYRSIICSNLNQFVLNKNFTLDGFKLSSSEVKVALDFIKRHRPISVPSNPLCTKELYDSSSLRTSFRKKPRNREFFVQLDSDGSTIEPEIEEIPNQDVLPNSQSSESLSGIKEAVVHLIERHGQENWLLRQSGKELRKLCNITQPTYPSTDVPAWVNTASTSGDCQMGTCVDTTDSSTSAPEIDGEDSMHRNITDSSNDLYSCLNDDSDEFPPENFTDHSGEAKIYQTFLNGQVNNIIIQNRNLFEVDPRQSDLILTKWDLKSLKELTPGKIDFETETIEIQLTFDTLKKNLRERTFIMSQSDFAQFEEETAEYVKTRTLQEFDSYQCLKCNSVFSRGMAASNVVEVSRVVTEVSICPYCESEMLVVLENIPLPNNECMEMDGLTTPVSVSDNQEESEVEALSCDTSSTEEFKPNSSGNDGSGSEEIIEVDEAIEILADNDTYAVYEKTITDADAEASKNISISTKIHKPLTRIMSSFSIKKALTKTLSGSKSPTGITLYNTTDFIPLKYDYSNYSVVDHRIQLYIELSVFKYEDEKLLALVKGIVLSCNGIAMPSLVIFTDRKIYIYKITGPENDQPESWLSKFGCYPINKLYKLDVLIGRHGVGLDLSSASKYFALLLRDAKRTSDFVEFFQNEVCCKINSLCLVHDVSLSQKVLLSPVNTINYFGILNSARISEGFDRTYPVSAIILTNEELVLVTDISWLVNKGNESNSSGISAISAKYVWSLDTLTQMESKEYQPKYLRLVFQMESDDNSHWDLYFETTAEKENLFDYLKTSCETVPCISLSQPKEA